MYIVDSHAHLGETCVFDVPVTEEELIGAMDEHGIDTSIVFPLPGARDKEVHTEIAKLAQKYPGRIKGLVSINPHIPEEEYYGEVERCVKKLNFFGIKLHPFGHACPVNCKDADKVFDAARLYKMPLIIHSGLGAPYSLPSVFIPRIKKYPDIPIIIAHAGAYLFTEEAIVTASLFSNVYLETSWCGTHRIVEMVHKIGADRVMFGADIPANVGSELAKYTTSKLTTGELEKVLGQNAKELFKI